MYEIPKSPQDDIDYNRNEDPDKASIRNCCQDGLAMLLLFVRFLCHAVWSSFPFVGALIELH